MEKGYAFPAVFYFESSSKKENDFQIHITYPDLLHHNIPASAVHSDRGNIMFEAKELLKNSILFAYEKGIEFPEATASLEKVSIDRNDLTSDGVPYRIEISVIFISVDELEQEQEEDSIISWRLHDDRCIISSIAGRKIREGAYSAEKLRRLAQAISKSGQPFALNIDGRRIEVNGKQSIKMKEELEWITEELEKSEKSQ
ncbi:hypothetical protein [Pseudalkalibacillus caeni]|uniref:Uncharacterized protein n=1 Tax=Exobacillus caeni TaxID=2574798 RepID=A0A5R9F2A0_9BACL|nr:hypothetical protein [Pseudalkalibacillus caeni]TLS35043.1 hypothetical protein FCL54_22555 [Pseudalkalibacillus caeni]